MNNQTSDSGPAEVEFTGRADLGTVLAASGAVSIESLGLSVRARNCLLSNGIRSVGHLARLTEYDLLSLRNLGQKSVVEIEAALMERGMSLAGPPTVDLGEAAWRMVMAVRDDGLHLPPRSRRALGQLIVALRDAGRLGGWLSEAIG